MTVCLCSICEQAGDEVAICRDCRRQHSEIRGALENLVSEVRGVQGPRVALGMRLSVALNVAERALRIRPVDR